MLGDARGQRCDGAGDNQVRSDDRKGPVMVTDVGIDCGGLDLALGLAFPLAIDLTTASTA